VLAADSREQVAKCAQIAPDNVIEMTDLVKRAFEKDVGAITDVFSRDQEFVIGCSRPRAVQALLDYAAIDVSALRITWLQLPFNRDALRKGYGTPWFPVIDRARCDGCGTCADYCLFSVYVTKQELPPNEKIRVTMPQDCKIGCPACARLCPMGALIFPFCHEPELNGEIADPQARSKEESLATLGDDPMRILAERKNKKRLIDPSKFEQAETDRITFSGVL
jgi:ferredoxin